MEIFISDWNFNSVYLVEKISNNIKNFIPDWNVNEMYEIKKAKPEAHQKQIKTKMIATKSWNL